MRDVIQRVYSRRGKKLSLLVLAGVMGLSLLGSGVYAALGGTARQSTSTDIELQRGLVTHMKMNGNLKDTTPYANNATTSTGSLDTDRKGKANSAYTTDGITQYAAIPDASNLDSASVTVSLWVTVNANIDCDANNNWRSLIRKGGTSSTTTGWDIVLEQNGSINWDIGIGGVTSRRSASTGLTQGITKLLTVTYDAATGEQVVYTNGVQAATKANTPTAIGANSSAIEIARGTNAVTCPNGGGYAPVTYDDVRIYNRAVAAVEAKALYDSYDQEIRAASGQGGLVGHWKLDGNAKDASPYANNGTVNIATLTTDRKSAANKAYAFSGTTGERISLPNTGEYNFIGLNNFSVTSWIKTTETSGQRCIFSTSPAGIGFRFGYDGGRPYYLVGSSDGNRQEGSIGSTSLNNGQWRHLAITYVYTTFWTVTAYIDGVNTGSVALPSSVGAPDGPAAYIGSMSGGTTGVVNGSIDDVRIYNTALSSAEIKQQYESYESQINLNASPTSSTSSGNINAGLVGYWPFSGNAKDATPYSNHGTVSGALLTTDRKGRASSAYAFDGTNDYIGLPNSAAIAGSSPPYTIAAWIKPTTYGTRGIVGWGNWGTSYEANALRMTTDGLLNYWWGRDLSATKSGLTDGNWHNVVAHYDGTTRAIYVDGAFVNSDTPIGYNPKALNVRIGSTNNGEYFSGSIDEVRIYNRALNSSEIQTLYNSQN